MRCFFDTTITPLTWYGSFNALPRRVSGAGAVVVGLGDALADGLGAADVDALLGDGCEGAEGR
ncbi:MAG: hypothetical protein LWW77_00845 [Propionibacteriales bacterium]|nr:hypothetical protein [Propionibacteriales bacterium]